jgi:hypothetical protein
VVAIGSVAPVLHHSSTPLAKQPAPRIFHQLTSRLMKKTHMLRCAQSPRYNVLAKYASARRFFARLASESF